MGRVRDPSSAGQSMTHVSFWGAYNSVMGGWKDLGCKQIKKCKQAKNLNVIFLLIICNFCVHDVCACICVCLSVFVCLFVHQCGCTVISELW